MQLLIVQKRMIRYRIILFEEVSVRYQFDEPPKAL